MVLTCGFYLISTGGSIVRDEHPQHRRSYTHLHWGIFWSKFL